MASIFYTSTIQAKSNDFPGRAEYPNVPIIEIDALREKFNDVVIVDARSSYEFDTLRIKGAVNIPVASDTFVSDLKKLVKKTNKPIVFYCNGRTCYKSYLAVKNGAQAGIKNLSAFDAGIFEWSRRHPDQAVLLGTTPVDPRKLISKNNLKSRLLSPQRFSNNIVDNRKKSMVLDIRDKYQRAGVGFYPGTERWTSLDNQKKLKKYIAMAKQKNKTLYIYDEVGKQVRWLQYALEKAGIKNYYFMDKGATGYYAMLKQQEQSGKNL